MAIEVFAPAKINLTLHVTGQRPDGYHLLESLVVFADIGDQLRVSKSDAMQITVDGPFAQGVPFDQRNLCWRAAELFGETVSIHLTKNLPHAAGIGGGSSDAAAVLNAMEKLFHRPCPSATLSLGADVPVCQRGRATLMSGIGETLAETNIRPLDAILVNPRVDVPTPQVFKNLTTKNNPAMTQMLAPDQNQALWQWLADQRNDLQAPAITVQPVIAEVLATLASLYPKITRMSGSGATCFALFESRAQRDAAAQTLKQRNPDWWVEATTLA